MDGVAITVKNYAYWLNKSNNPTCVITPEFPGYSDKDEFSVLRYLSTPIHMREPYRIGLPKLDPHINHALKNLSLDLVHAHSPFSAGALALKTARRNHIPLVATFHSKYRDDFMRIINQKTIVDHIVKRIIGFYRLADEVWIPQRNVEETIREYGYKGKLEIVENGTDIDVESDIPAFRSQSREILNIPQGRKVFLYVGQLVLEKNLKFLMESLKYITTGDFIVYFVGQGYARPLLEGLAREYGLMSKVKFTGAIYDREELKRFYAIADLFLFPSRYDNAPLVIYEAAALHTPALLLRDSTIAGLIQNDFNGFLSDNSPKQYAERINGLINNNELLTEAGSNASVTLCRPWQDVVNEVKDRYTLLCKNSRN